MNEVITPESLRGVVKSALREHDRERIDPNAVYYVNQVARMTNSSFRKVKALIKDGLLKTTKDGRISQKALDNYLDSKV